jgi:hypothetical protein
MTIWAILGGLGVLLLAKGLEHVAMRRLAGQWQKEQQRNRARGMRHRRFDTVAIIAIGFGLAAAALLAGFDAIETLAFALAFAIIVGTIQTWRFRRRTATGLGGTGSPGVASATPDPVAPERWAPPSR